MKRFRKLTAGLLIAAMCISVVPAYAAESYDDLDVAEAFPEEESVYSEVPETEDQETADLFEEDTDYSAGESFEETPEEIVPDIPEDGALTIEPDIVEEQPEETAEPEDTDYAEIPVMDEPAEEPADEPGGGRVG